MRRVRVVLLAFVLAVGMVGVTATDAGAKRTKKGYCKYVRRHQLEFLRIFGIETSVDTAAEISDKEIRGYLRVSPEPVATDWRTFQTLVRAIGSGDSDAISAAAPAAGPASQRIIDYTQNNCGSSLPPVSGTTVTTILEL